MWKINGAMKMPKIIPIKDLRNTTEISDLAHEINEPIFVTKNGYGDLVIMSVETYDEIIREKLIDNKLEKSINSINNGEKLYEASNMIAELKEKYSVFISNEAYLDIMNITDYLNKDLENENSARKFIKKI